MTDLIIVTVHGESASVFNVVDRSAPESEQPAVVAGFYSRKQAEEYIHKAYCRETLYLSAIVRVDPFQDAAPCWQDDCER